MIAAAAKPRVWCPGLVHAVLGLGGLAIGTTEFATMSLLPPFSKGLGVDAPPAVLGARLNRCTLLVLLMSWFALGNGLSALAPSFGALVAAGLVPDAQRTAAIGRVLTGLAVATIVGVPLANLLASAGAGAGASVWRRRSPSSRSRW